MNTNIKTAAKLAALAGAFALTGCALTVHPTYTPPEGVTKVPGANNVVLAVVVKNEKQHKNGQISWMRNGYDMKVAGLYMHVTQDFQSAIDKALTDRGFIVSKNGQQNDGRIEVIVRHLFSKETNDFSGVIQDGRGSLTVVLKNNGGQTVYKNNIIFKNDIIKGSAWGFTTDRSAIAKSMLNLSVNKIFEARGFYHAITDLSRKEPLGTDIPRGG